MGPPFDAEWLADNVGEGGVNTSLGAPGSDCASSNFARSGLPAFDPSGVLANMPEEEMEISLAGHFDMLSVGGWSESDFEPGVREPYGLESAGELGGFTSGLAIHRDVRPDKVSGSYEQQTRRKEGVYDSFGGNDLKVGLDWEDGLNGSPEEGESRWLGGQGLDVGLNRSDGMYKTRLHAAEGSAAGVDIGHLDPNSVKDQVLSAEDLSNNHYLSGGSENFGGRQVQLGDRLPAGGDSNPRQDAANLSLGEQHGSGAHFNLAQGQLDVRACNHVDAVPGVRDIGTGIGNSAAAVRDRSSSGARSGPGLSGR